jgi:hypothetical protein
MAMTFHDKLQYKKTTPVCKYQSHTHMGNALILIALATVAANAQTSNFVHAVRHLHTKLDGDIDVHTVKRELDMIDAAFPVESHSLDPEEMRHVEALVHKIHDTIHQT